MLRHKYIVGLIENKEAIFVFPADVDHNVFWEYITFVELLNGNCIIESDYSLISAGFITNGKCHGASSTLDVKSRGQVDSDLLHCEGILHYLIVEGKTTDNSFIRGNNLFIFPPILKVTSFLDEAIRGATVGHHRWYRPFHARVVTSGGNIENGLWVHNPDTPNIVSLGEKDKEVLFCDQVDGFPNI